MPAFDPKQRRPPAQAADPRGSQALPNKMRRDEIESHSRSQADGKQFHASAADIAAAALRSNDSRSVLFEILSRRLCFLRVVHETTREDPS